MKGQVKQRSGLRRILRNRIMVSDTHHRRSIRLQGYNYAQAGAYFVTICTQNRECLLGKVVGGEMALNDAGRIAQEMWNRLPGRFPTVELDQFVVMPNHLRGILVLVGAQFIAPTVHVRKFDEQKLRRNPSMLGPDHLATNASSPRNIASVVSMSRGQI